MHQFEIVKDEFRKHPDAQIQLPKRATAHACAYDFFAPCDDVILPSETKMIWTDVKAHLPSAYMLMLNIRSSMGKKRVMLANVSGWADSDYYSNPDNDGNIGLMLHNWGTEPFVINYGDRIAQGMIVKYYMMEDDTTSASRKGGFGSTGQ